MRNRVRIVLAAIAAAILASCGGNGSGSLTHSSPQVLPPSTGGGPSSTTSVNIPKFTVVDLGAGFNPTAVNRSNMVVGWRWENAQTVLRAAVYENGTTSDLALYPGDTNSQAFDVNDSGQIVGYSSVSSAQNQTLHALLWSGTSFTYLGSLPQYAGGKATAINNRGEIVGQLIY
jgi:probable HAF family extracellular repeat protein